MSNEQGPDIVKWYTRARKFPQLIGRTPDGMKLWGGPYTITQAVGFGLVLFVGLNTMSLWARFGFVGNFVVLGTVAVGVVFGLGRIPVGSRSPLSVGAGAWKAVASPQHGRLGGRPVRIRRPHRLRHSVLVQLGTALPSQASPQVIARTEETPRSLLRGPERRETPPPTDPASSRTAPALTGVQALLASCPDPHQHRSENPR